MRESVGAVNMEEIHKDVVLLTLKEGRFIGKGDIGNICRSIDDGTPISLYEATIVHEALTGQGTVTACVPIGKTSFSVGKDETVIVSLLTKKTPYYLTYIQSISNIKIPHGV